MAFGKSVEDDVRKVLLVWAQIAAFFVLLAVVWNATCNFFDNVRDETNRKIRAEKAAEWREYLEERRKRQESRGKD